MDEDSDKPLTKKEKRALTKEQKQKDKAKEKQTASLKKWGVIAIAVLVIAFLGYKFVNWARTPEPEVPAQAISITDSDWVRGNPEALVELIEYGDFQCPACATFASQVKRLNEDFPDDLKIAFRHFPLTNIHKNAVDAALASEAAGKQEKFWEMHDLLYENQEDWSEEGGADEIFEGYANELELDIEVYKVDFGSDESKSRVDTGLTGGRALRVNATPTFYLNGNKIEPRSYDEFKGLVEVEIQSYTEE